MRNKVIPLEEVPAFVSDGADLFVGGFSMYKVPLGMVRELARARRRDLVLRTHIDGMATEMLLATDSLREVRSSYVGLDLVGLAPLFTEAVARGRVAFVEETEGTSMWGMKAAIYRLPYMPSRALVGTDIVRRRPDLQEYDCPLTAERLVAMPPVTADVAFLHAQRADPDGNIAMEGTLCVDIDIAKVAERVVVSVEEVVSREELVRQADTVRIPGHLVDAVVELPGGAYPSSCVPYYDVDLTYLLDYVDTIKAGRLDDYVAAHLGPESFSEYVATRLSIRQGVER